MKTALIYALSYLVLGGAMYYVTHKVPTNICISEGLQCGR